MRTDRTFVSDPLIGSIWPEPGLGIFRPQVRGALTIRERVRGYSAATAAAINIVSVAI